MLSLEIYKKIPIPHQDGNVFTDIKKINTVFYFCSPNDYKIVEYNSCYQKEASYSVKKRYNHICYCDKEDCFFATTIDHCNQIFKLNKCFEEVDCYYVKNLGCHVLFTGIDYFENQIYLSCQNYIIVLSLHCLDKPKIWLEDSCCLTGVSKAPCYLLTSHHHCYGSSLMMYDDCQNLKLTTCLPCDYTIQSITYDHRYIYILVSKCECYDFVLVCQIQSHCHHQSCHYECNDIIESIALIETSLSHILNAEGEKLQKIIATCDDPKTILEVNKAVNHTITNVTHLEHVLYSKLETAKNLCEKKK